MYVFKYKKNAQQTSYYVLVIQAKHYDFCIVQINKTTTKIFFREIIQYISTSKTQKAKYSSSALRYGESYWFF